MPKPIYGIAGSGMHINMSLFHDGENVFYDEKDRYGLSETAYQLYRGCDGARAFYGRRDQSARQLL